MQMKAYLHSYLPSQLPNPRPVAPHLRHADQRHRKRALQRIPHSPHAASLSAGDHGTHSGQDEGAKRRPKLVGEYVAKEQVQDNARQGTLDDRILSGEFTDAGSTKDKITRPFRKALAQDPLGPGWDFFSHHLTLESCEALWTWPADRAAVLHIQRSEDPTLNS
jgi:hypothetical protein